MTQDSRPVMIRLCPFPPDLEAALAERGQVIDWPALAPDERSQWLNDHAGVVRAIITNGHVGAPRDLVEALPALGLIAVNGVGYDQIDIAHAAAHGVAVANTPDVLTDDVADLAVGLVIGLIRQIARADAFVRGGAWAGGNMPLARKVTGRRFGIVGLGRIGHAIARRLSVFGPVAYTGRAPKPVAYDFHPDPLALAATCDVLIVACAATPATRHLIDARVLNALGPDGVLVNVARGSVVDEAALVAAVESGSIAGAALDVFEDEPNVPAALIDSPATLLTPHIASATVETRGAMAALVLGNLDAFLAGGPLLTPVSPA
jgi:lactate dehydrogenase-like 2-hydroxyacid dehydrogenase